MRDLIFSVVMILYAAAAVLIGSAYAAAVPEPRPPRPADEAPFEHENCRCHLEPATCRTTLIFDVVRPCVDVNLNGYICKVVLQ